VDIEQQSYPGGMPRRVTVTMSRTADGEDEEVTVGYNRPIVLQGGAVALLLGRYGQVAGGAVLALGPDLLELQPGERGRLGDTEITLSRVATGRSLRVPVADLTVTGGSQPRHTMLPLMARAPAGDELAFVDVLVTPAVMLNERSNPTAPYTLALSLVLVLGVTLAGLEHARRRRGRSSVS